MQTYKNLPVGIIGTTLALCTLSNAYNTLGFSWVRVICMLIGFVVWFMAFVKITRNFSTVQEEYMSNTVTATLYATFSMLLMVLSSFVVEFIPVLGKALWLTGIVIQIILIVMLFALHIFKKRNIDVILPSWYVTLLGLLVSTAIGGDMGFVVLKKAIVTYGFLMYFSTLPFVIYRLIKKDLPAPARYTKTILIAPISLILIGYINIIAINATTFDTNVILVLYLILLLTLLYIGLLFKGFLKGGFTYGWAALTFPMAIGCIASLKSTAYFAQVGMNNLSFFSNQLAGIQIIISSAVILFVFISFVAKKDTWN